MRNSTIGSLVAASALVALASGCVTGAYAESQASMEAGSMSSTSTASQAGGENNSQSSNSNSTMSTNQQTSASGGENYSQAGAEAIGGPLTNMRPNTPAPSGSAASKPNPYPSSITTNPLNNGDAGNSVGNVVNGEPTGKGTANSAKKKSNPDGNRQISDVSGAKPASTKQANTGSKSIFAPHIVTRTYRWFRR